RGTGCGATVETSMTQLPIGKGVLRRQGEKVAILSFGTMLPAALEAAENLNATVADMRFVKPLDEAMIDELVSTHDVLVTVEENAIAGGAGSGVVEYLMKSRQIKPVLQIGLPDTFIHQGTQQELHEELELDGKGIEAQIRRYLN
ncbi:transketolase C-terminal domain-containing protein, partial [Enterovibrio norvegicus]|uniref:transketolase C-terminal domain-containing protein n=1 Tax=Enterovibrio norvegicus TaxID=188144 RepID=UPI000360EE42